MDLLLQSISQRYPPKRSQGLKSQRGKEAVSFQLKRALKHHCRKLQWSLSVNQLQMHMVMLL